MEILGYIAAALIGLSLGLIGGGGSILTVPILVYIFRLQPVVATSYSLFIVGITSLVGAWNNYRKGWISFKTGLLFGAASIFTVFATRRFVIPAIPESIATIGNFQLTFSLLTMVSFAVLMLAASIALIREKPMTNENADAGKKRHLPKMIFTGIGIGLVTGFLGAGGGFLLIPTLVLLLGLPMKEAIGTSLFIIALNSLIGFSGDIGNIDPDWLLLIKITAIAIAGVFIGGEIGKKIAGEKLKKGFGWFVLLMGIYIILKEVIIH